MDVKAIVVKSLIRLNEEHSKERQLGRYYPSESWSCLRKKVYSFFKYEQETPLPLGLFEMGRRTEDAFYEMLKSHFNEKKVGNDVHIEIKLEDYIISGDTDPVIYETTKRKNIRTLFEVKSMANLSAVKEPNIHHIKQTTCYMKALNLKLGMIVYINRSNLEDLKAFEVEFKEEDWQSIVTHFDMLHGFLKDKVLPTSTPLMNWECRYCSYKNRCISDGKESFKLKKVLA